MCFTSCHIVIVSEDNVTPSKEDQLESIKYLRNNKDTIMKYLISSCDTNNIDVIVVISKSDIIFDVNEKIINKFNISTNIITFISELEEKLMSICHRVVCGIRNKTLIINICGSKEDAKTCLTIYEEMIKQAAKLISRHGKEHHETKTTHNIELKPLIEVIQAQEIICDAINRSNEKISKCMELYEVHGKILLTDIYAKCNVPPFNTSANHGFAIIANDKKNKKILKAGSTFLEPDTCVRVKTGDPIPDGATAVVKIKDASQITENTSSNCEEIKIINQPEEGKNIRPIGCEVKVGEKILNKYTRIGLAEIRLLASCGINEINAIKPQNVGILSIKNKIVDKDETKESKSNHIYSGNKLTLTTLLKQKGFDVLDFEYVDNEILNILLKIEQALTEVNVFVITGYIVEKDQLKKILNYIKTANIHFDSVNMKPGKSTTYITCVLNGRYKHILFLPGNSATVLITAHLFLLPLLNKMHHNDLKTPVIRARVTNEYKKYSRPNYVWARLEWDKTETDLFAKVSSTPENNNLLQSHNANALLIVPAASDSDMSLLPGTLTPVLLLDS